MCHIQIGLTVQLIESNLCSVLRVAIAEEDEARYIIMISVGFNEKELNRQNGGGMAAASHSICFYSVGAPSINK